jgi:hypothetical protein
LSLIVVKVFIFEGVDMAEITDTELLMYLDGVVAPEIKAQIEGDEQYRQRVQVLSQQQNEWVARLYRVNCPEPLTLGEFHLDRLHPRQKKPLENHLAVCPHCARELAEMAGFVQLETGLAPAEVLKDVVKIFAQLISGKGLYGTPRQRPSAALRGGGTENYQYEAGSAKIALSVHEDGETPGLQALVGIIAGVEAENYEVSLWQAGDKVGRAQIDEVGGFTIGGLQPGEYQLIIHGPQVEIHVQSFVV